MLRMINNSFLNNLNENILHLYAHINIETNNLLMHACAQFFIIIKFKRSI
jgi:hypothetical protein